MAAERLKKIKEEPLLDDKIPHPYREVVKELRSVTQLLREISEKLPPIVIPPKPPLPLGVITLDDSTIKKLAGSIASRLLQLPNRLDRIEIDTSKTDWVSLRKAGKIKPSVALGFWVEDIGGGFEYKIVRQGFGPIKSRTAAADDKWEQEFDDLQVKGSGAGTAVIYMWWREPILL